MEKSSSNLEIIPQQNKVKQYPSEGVEELAVSGYIGARRSESSPIPSDGYSFVIGAGSKSFCGVPVGGGDGTAGGGLGLILDLVAKRSEGENEGLEKACPGGFITGSCENGHRFAKEIYCGREWCPTCNGKWVKGADMKPSHARRFARWYEKAQQIDSMGYWTFTIPEWKRAEYRSQEKLTKLGHDIQELLKSFGYERGLRRWHWFGDKSEKYHPHLNCLVDGGLLNHKALRAIRRAYSGLLGVKLAIAEYHYFEGVPQKVHALKYVTRATFLDAKWDIPMALELRGFRNQLWWGSKRWDTPMVWSLDDMPEKLEAGTNNETTKAVACLERGECPLCGLPIKWCRWQPIKLLPELGGWSLGDGYWVLPEVSPPLYRYTDEALAWVSPDSGKCKKSLRGSYLPVERVDSRLAEFSRQHQRFVANWLWCQHLDDEEGLNDEENLLNEVS